MAYRIERSAQVQRDIENIFDYLVRAYQEFGDSTDEAINRGQDRITELENNIGKIARQPHQGTLNTRILPNLRVVTKNKFIIYFVVNDSKRTVKVLAIFFGAQDHIQHILKRGPAAFE